MKHKSQAGFSAFEGILIVLVVAALALAGWLVWDKNKKEDSKSSTTTTSQTSKNKSDTKQSTSAPQVAYLTIDKWSVKLVQPKDHTLIAGAQFYGQDHISGALDGLNLYLDGMDSAYTCDSNSGETHKAVFGSVQQFPLTSKIEENTKNKPDAIATVGDYKYGFYAIQNPDECYDAASRATVKTALEQYKKDFAVAAK